MFIYLINQSSYVDKFIQCLRVAKPSIRKKILVTRKLDHNEASGIEALTQFCLTFHTINKHIEIFC